jgi:hypothetical protein
VNAPAPRATKRMLLERCEIDDGQSRSIGEPLSGGTLAAAKAAKTATAA